MAQTKQEIIEELQAQIKTLAEKLEAAEQTKDYNYKRFTDISVEMQSLHAVLDALGVARTVAPTTQYQCATELQLSARFMMYQQELLMQALGGGGTAIEVI